MTLFPAVLNSYSCNFDAGNLCGWSPKSSALSTLPWSVANRQVNPLSGPDSDVWGEKTSNVNTQFINFFVDINYIYLLLIQWGVFWINLASTGWLLNTRTTCSIWSIWWLIWFEALSFRIWATLPTWTWDLREERLRARWRALSIVWPADAGERPSYYLLSFYYMMNGNGISKLELDMRNETGGLHRHQLLMEERQ